MKTDMQTEMTLDQIVDLKTYPLGDTAFQNVCRAKIDDTGVLALPGFTTGAAIKAIHAEGCANQHRVYASAARHTVYLSPRDPAFAPDHARNRLVTSSKGCITDDLVSADSSLRTLYNAPEFRTFLCQVLGETALFEYADPLSSINLHYAETGQELGWHFDNSSFAITLMVQPPERGGAFEYVSGLRDADAGDMAYDAVTDVLDGKTAVQQIIAEAGTLVLFRGRNSLHRVAPNLGVRTRMLAVLAYNSAPGIELSEKARLTFYGRTG
jgi:hypothetical protein